MPPARSLAVFLALGVGFAAPFLVLALIPGLAAKMPPPGPWMDMLKRVLAFPMLGAAVCVGVRLVGLRYGINVPTAPPERRGRGGA